MVTPVVFASAAAVTAWLLGLQTFAQLDAALWFGGITLTAVLAAMLESDASGALDRPTLPLSFVIAMGALLFFDPLAMTFTATAAVLMHALTIPPRARPFKHTLVNVAAAIAATQIAGFAYVVLGGSGKVTWPWKAAPIAAAVVLYGLVWIGLPDLVAAFAARRSVTRSWMRHVLESVSSYFVAGAVAVALVEAIDHRMWDILVIAAVPLGVAYRAYAGHVERIDREHRRRESLESLDQAIAVLDDNGRITLWNDALVHLTGCPRDRALGRSCHDAMPVLTRSELPRAIHDALRSRGFHAECDVIISTADGERTLRVDILPEVDGAMMRWSNLTGRISAEHALQRTVDRFALAAEGANDGLWEWDLRTRQLYVSARWRAMLGLSLSTENSHPDQWLLRIHADDRRAFDEALEAHLAGRSEQLHAEIRLRHEDGVYRRFLCRGVAAGEPDAPPARIAGSLTDISDGTIARERIRSAEFRDSLTGLCNRAVFVKGLGQRLRELKEKGGFRFAVLYLDLDRFKIVNDSLGHLVGDELLIAVSRRLESCLRAVDTLARMGGDEFAILLNDLNDPTQANAIAFRIQDTLSAPFSIGGREIVTSASIGIAFCRTEYGDPEEMVRDADTAMYHAKAHGKGRHELFDADMHAREGDRLGFESDLREAVKRHDFELNYQPIVSISSGMCAGFEALVRWKRNGQPVSPVQFIPLAEELGLIEALGTWVLQEACRTFAGWQKRFPANGLECITVNVSTRQLMQQGFVLLVEQTLEKTGMKPADLRLEITETALMDAPDAAAQMLRDLRELGVKIYLDDFGTGYSSLSHLHKLPVDALKIDRSFVRSLTTDGSPGIVQSILALARTLNTNVVAEGVESEVQARELERLGCRQAQGYFYSKPLSVKSVEEVLVARRPLGQRRLPSAIGA